MTLDYILKNLMYEMTVDGTIVYKGTVDYVTEHLTDGVASTIKISDNQPKDISDFVLRYKKASTENPNLTLEQFYNDENL